MFEKSDSKIVRVCVKEYILKNGIHSYEVAWNPSPPASNLLVKLSRKQARLQAPNKWEILIHTFKLLKCPVEQKHNNEIYKH